MPILPENRNRYPLNWKAISERIRFVRAAFQCECAGECGIDHQGRCVEKHNAPSTVSGKKVVLTVAHLDHTPEHNEDHNLKAMCQRCHNRYDREHRNETRNTTNGRNVCTKHEVIMYSFTMPCDYTIDNLAMVEQACAMRVEEVNREVAKSNKDSDMKGSSIRYHCNVYFDVKPGVDNIRVNVHGGIAKDAMIVGYNFCMLQMNPSLRNKPAKSDQ